MFGGDRGDDSKIGLIGTAIVVAVGAAMYCAMFYSMGFGSGQHHGQAQVEREHHASDTPKQIEGKCGSKAGAEFRECVTEIVEAERESQRSESDLVAQWKAADWVMWAGVLAGAQLVATVVGLYFVKGTLDATLQAVADTSKATAIMERQNEIAQRSMVEQLRPWLTAEISDGWLFPGGTDGGESLTDTYGAISAIVSIRNSGQTVAREIRVLVTTRADPSAFSTKDRVKNQHRLNQSGRLPDLFPGDTSSCFQLTGVGRTTEGFLVTILYTTVFDAPEAEPRVTEHFFKVEVGGHYPNGDARQLKVDFSRAHRDDVGVQ